MTARSHRDAPDVLRRWIALMKGCALYGVVIIVITSTSGCCVRSVRTVDVTHNPSFAGGYRAGQAYRIKVPVHIMSIVDDRQFDVTSDMLWTDEAFRHYDEAEPLVGREFLVETSIPAGATITITRLEYRVDEYGLCFSAMKPQFPELLAIGELSSGNRRTSVIAPVGSLRHKHDVVGPDNQKVWVIPTDPDVIEPIDPPG